MTNKTKKTPELNWCPYIKPTRRVHDSGYRTFEVGYCLVEGAKVVKKRVIGDMADHIWEDPIASLVDKNWKGLNIDLTKDGYIRFFSHTCKLKWSSDICFSTMELIQEEHEKS